MLPTWQNVENYIGEMTPAQFLARPTNMACQDLCVDKPMPPGTRCLLDLVLRPLPTNNLNKTIQKVKETMRRDEYFHNNPRKEREGTHYIRGLYLKTNHARQWADTLVGTERTKQCLDKFERDFTATAASYSKKMCLSNLTNKQWRLTDTLKSSDKHIVLEADKNLGGCATERSIYMRKGVDEHLGDRDVYKPLTKTEAQRLSTVTRYKINILLTKYKDEITSAVWVYIHEGLYQFVDRIARFRMSAKVHKFPWKTRPIVCCVGTSMNCVSKWLD